MNSIIFQAVILYDIAAIIIGNLQVLQIHDLCTYVVYKLCSLHHILMVVLIHHFKVYRWCNGVMYIRLIYIYMYIYNIYVPTSQHERMPTDGKLKK